MNYLLKIYSLRMIMWQSWGNWWSMLCRWQCKLIKTSMTARANRLFRNLHRECGGWGWNNECKWDCTV